MDIHKLAPDEPLSPEVVLVLPPELRAQVLAALPAPAWPTPRPRIAAPRAAAEAPAVAEPPAVAAVEPFEASLRALLVSRVVQLGLIFIAVTIVVLVMSLVASAMR